MGVTNHLLTGMILQVVPHHPTSSGVQKKAKIAGMWDEFIPNRYEIFFRINSRSELVISHLDVDLRPLSCNCHLGREDLIKRISTNPTFWCDGEKNLAIFYPEVTGLKHLGLRFLIQHHVLPMSATDQLMDTYLLTQRRVNCVLRQTLHKKVAFL